MSYNPTNNVTVYGRLSKDAVFFENQNGSHKMYITVAAKNNFRRKGEEKYGATFVDLEKYLSESIDIESFPFNALKTGATVAVGASVRKKAYEGKDGKTHYEQYLEIESLNFIKGASAKQDGAEPADEDGEEAAEAEEATEEVAAEPLI